MVLEIAPYMRLLEVFEDAAIQLVIPLLSRMCAARPVANVEAVVPESGAKHTFMRLVKSQNLKNMEDDELLFRKIIVDYYSILITINKVFR